MLYKVRNSVIIFFDDYFLMVSEAKLKAKNKASGKGLKLLTPKQMPQRSPIAIAQVKEGNNSESLLNEIRQIVCFSYLSKKNHQKSIK